MRRAVLMVAAVLAASVVMTPAAVQKYPGTPVKSGQAAFTFGGKAYTFTAVEGGFEQIEGFTSATLVFRDPRDKTNTHLNLSLVYQGPGKVDFEAPFSMNGLSMFVDGDVGRFTKGKSKCAVTLTTATAADVAGTADCPLLHTIAGEPQPALAGLKFSATTK